MALPPEMRPNISSNPPRVEIVDDDVFSASLVGELAQIAADDTELSIQVTQAHSLPEFISSLENKPDVLVVDFQLVGFGPSDTFKVIEELRRKEREAEIENKIKIIGISALAADPSIMEQAKTAGVDVLVEKPFENELVIGEVKKALEHIKENRLHE